MSKNDWYRMLVRQGNGLQCNFTADLLSAEKNSWVIIWKPHINWIFLIDLHSVITSCMNRGIPLFSFLNFRPVFTHLELELGGCSFLEQTCSEGQKKTVDINKKKKNICIHGLFWPMECGFELQCNHTRRMVAGWEIET